MRIATALLLMVIANQAEACQRCGLFGLRCRYYVAPVVKQVVAPAYVAPVAYQQPNILVVQNAYGPPNGVAGLLAQQGSSVYGYQAAASSYFVSPAEVLRQAAELSRAASATASIGLTGYNTTAQTQLALQAGITSTVAKGQAAAQVLTAAGLSEPQQQTQSLALKIVQQNGRWQVLSAEPAEVNAQIRAEINATPSQPEIVPPPAPRPASVIAAKCAQCHGLNLTEPKGSVFLDAGHQLDCSVVVKALKLIKAGKMPKDGSLTDQEKGAIFDELLSLEKPQ